MRWLSTVILAIGAARASHADPRAAMNDYFDGEINGRWTLMGMGAVGLGTGVYLYVDDGDVARGASYVTLGMGTVHLAAGIYFNVTCATQRANAGISSRSRAVFRGGGSNESSFAGRASFCRLHGRYVDAEKADEQRYLDIRPQPCWFAAGGRTFEMSLGGSATFDADDRFAVVLTGTFDDLETRVRGGATVELTESW